MNAAQARKRRGGTTLIERNCRDPQYSAVLDVLGAVATIELLVQQIMEREQVTPSELAKRINVRPPQISRDLHGGFSRATIARLGLVADALGYDFLPAFVPRDDMNKRAAFLKALKKLQQTKRAVAVTKTSKRRPKVNA